MVDFGVNLSTGGSMERAQSISGADRSRQRYPGDDYQDLEEISDPHRARDETGRNWREWVAAYRWYLLVVALLGIVVAAILASLGARLFPGWLENIWVRRIGIVGVLVLGAYLGGRRQQLAAFKGVDTLTLRLPDGVRRYHGKVEAAADDDRMVFVPIKGWSWFGNPGEPYTLGELSSELPLNPQAANLSEGHDVRIGLHPAFATVAKTAFGGVVAQLTGGLEVYPWGRSFNVRATTPNTAEESRLADLGEQLDRTQSEVRNVREEKNQIERQRDNARALAKQSYKENIEMFAEHVDMMSGAFDTDEERDREQLPEDIPLEEDFDLD